MTAAKASNPYAVHHDGTCKVVKAGAETFFEPCLKTKIAVPDHAFKKRIDHRNNGTGSKQLRHKACALGNAAGNNGRNGGGKGQQKKNLINVKPCGPNVSVSPPPLMTDAPARKSTP